MPIVLAPPYLTLNESSLDCRCAWTSASRNQVVHDLALIQGRITKLGDVPTLAPFFFAKPDYSSTEAQKMYHTFSSADYRTCTGF